MDFNEIQLFDKKSFADVLKDIYRNSTAKEKEIRDIIKELTPHIASAADAAVIMPLIVDCLNTGVKNDEQLIKMLNIVQRSVTTKSDAGGGGISLITEEDKAKILSGIRNAVTDELISAEDEIDGEIDDIKQQLATFTGDI